MILLMWMFLNQQMVETDGELWNGIARAEVTLHRAVDGIRDEISVFASDPVRGYAIDGKGIIMVVPIRHRAPKVSSVNVEFPGTMVKGRDGLLKRDQLERAVKQWRQSLSKKRAAEQANFEKAVDQVRTVVPVVLDQLGGLPDQMPLIIIVEEREPAWAYASFGPHNSPKRRIATLEVSPQLAAQIEAGRSDWTADVAREDSERIAVGAVALPE